jgi:hypothetical protein
MTSTHTVTQKAAKKIPSQVHSPPRTKKKPNPKKIGKNLKQGASESDDDEVEELDLDSLRPKVKEKRYRKRQHIDESEEDDEIIEENVEPSIEEVNDVNAEQSSNDEASTGLIPHWSGVLTQC